MPNEQILPTAEAFRSEKPNLSVSATPSQLPFQGSQGRSYTNRSIVERPSSTAAAVPLTYYGIAATGSYILLDSLRDAPPRWGRLGCFSFTFSQIFLFND